MASNGNGVNLDASVPPLRITCHQESHADCQSDGLNTAYNLNKIWACMGRAGVNGVMRGGLVEYGDPFTPAPAGWIEPVAGGAFGGANLWDTVTAYNPLGGLATGDYCIFGALDPPDELFLHLGAALGAQPTFVVEYATGGAAWAALTVIATPDFTQANGRVVQRLKFTRPSGWGEQLIVGSAMPRGYYTFRLYLAAPLGVGPQANVNYKDWLFGYHKNWYCHYDIKRGDDTAATDVTTFSEPGRFSIKFRANFSFATKTTILDAFELGERHLAGTTYRPGYGWSVAATKGQSLRGVSAYGGAFLLHPRHDAETTGLTLWGAANVNRGVAKYCIIAGCNVNGVTLGGTGATAMMELANVLAWDAPSALAGSVVGAMNIDPSQGRAKNVIVAGMPGEARLINSTVASAILQALQLVGDGASLTQAQVTVSGAGTKFFYTPQWADASKKAISSSGGGYELWYAPGYVSDEITELPIIIPFRITDSAGVVQADGLTGADGHTNFINSASGTYGVPAVGVKNKNVIAAASFTSPGPDETPLDDSLLIEVNPADHASFNPAYESKEIRSAFPRSLKWNDLIQDYEVVPYQRENFAWAVALGPPAAPAANPDVLVSTVQIPAASEMRFEAPVPEVV